MRFLSREVRITTCLFVAVMTGCALSGGKTNGEPADESLAASAAGRTSVAGFDVQTAVSEVRPGVRQFTISYTPYTKAQEAMWYRSIQFGEGDRLGKRPYWSRYLPLPGPDIWPFPRDYWKEQPTLLKVPEGIPATEFRATLRTDKPDEWGKLNGVYVDEIVLSYLVHHELGEFVKENRAPLEKLASDYASRPGFPTALSASDEFFSAPAEYRDAAVLKGVLYQVEEASGPPQPRRSPASHLLTKKKDELRTKLRDKAAIAEIPARIPKVIEPEGDLTKPTLLVVHASLVFDEDATAKAGIDTVVANFRKAGNPVVFVMHPDDNADYFWYTADRKPTVAVHSEGGEHNLHLKTPDVTVVGGFFGNYDTGRGCHYKALLDAISRYFAFTDRPERLRIHIPTRAIYYYDDDLVTAKKLMDPRADAKAAAEDVKHLLYGAQGSEEFGDTNSRAVGPLSLQDYTFEYFVDGKKYITHGQGKKVVEFRIERTL